MGSPKETDVKTNPQMADHKKSIKDLLKKPFRALFQKDKQKKPKNEEIVNEKKNVEALKEKATIETVKDNSKNVKITPVTELLENFKKLQIEKEKKVESDNDEEDEFKNFTIIRIENKTKKNVLTDSQIPYSGNGFHCKYESKTRGNARIDSNSSEDSGFADKINESEDDSTEIESKENVEVKTEHKKIRKKQTVVISRGKIDHQKTIKTHRIADYTTNTHPYGHEKINKVNRQTFSGGQVIVNPDILPIKEVLMEVDNNVQRFEQKTHQEKEEDWDIAQEYINMTNIHEEYALDRFGINETSNALCNNISADLEAIINDEIKLNNQSVFLTPPRSEALSPQSDNYRSVSEYTLSPERLCSDYEKYQEILPVFEEYPICVTESLDNTTIEKNKERASMTMKQFKDMQKEIASGFSKMECCQENKKCRQTFQEYLLGLTIDERKDMCLKVSKLDLEDAYGVLQQILCNLSSDAGDVAVPHALFMLICEKLLATKPKFFVNEYGLNLLKSAVFLCHSKPILTRYLVHCIRIVTRSESYRSTKGHVFHEVDAAGDTLLVACARAGDTHAAVLAELVCGAAPADVALFDVHHANADGCTALHVACLEHSESSPHTHTVHVLLQHAGADLWRGDIKGGDTPVHLAVNSVGCSLTLLLLLFHRLPRASWKKLAHAQNRSSLTPLEYARSAIKSATRQNYPVEVLDFLKKCR